MAPLGEQQAPSRVARWLQECGLSKLSGNFNGMGERKFLDLTMRELQDYGVVEPDHKYLLYYKIKDVRHTEGLPGEPTQPAPSTSGRQAGQPAAVAGSAPQEQEQDLGHAGDLLDLEEHDGDLLLDVGAPFHLSPIHDAGPGRPAPDGPSPAPDDPPKIRVVVRKRPINRKERERADEDIVEVNREGACVMVNETKVKVDLTRYTERHCFVFDEALDEGVTNDQVYAKTVQPLVPTLFANGKATCFAYGQTGSGKTYTMSPLPIRAAEDLLAVLVRPEYADVHLFVSCFEIYGNKVYDLLNGRKKLNILEDGRKNVCVVGLKEHSVSSVDVVQTLIEEANTRRSTGSTAANADSSRSHSIMQFALKRFIAGGQHSRLVGKISFIDLAGSERGADTYDNNRQTRLEGAEINKSLLALKECIRALDCDARHVPFRGSKLTAVLRDSFVGGNARTVMIANISPTATCVEHSLNTLRYADRVKELRKDRAERAPGGVTPGDELNYFAAAHRSASDADARPEHAAVGGAPAPAPRRAPTGAAGDAWAVAPDGDDAGALAASVAAAPGVPLALAAAAAGAGGVVGPRGGGALSQVEEDREELMESILEDEEEIIAVHRAQIEETMDIVRREMNLLAEVDQPGSAIDQYVDQLEAILAAKAEGIRQLQTMLERFKGKLAQEEVLATTAKKAAQSKSRIAPG